MVVEPARGAGADPQGDLHHAVKPEKGYRTTVFSIPPARPTNLGIFSPLLPYVGRGHVLRSLPFAQQSASEALPCGGSEVRGTDDGTKEF